jgi:ketosteroid isomerase-like protein
MLGWIARWMIRRSIQRLNEGDSGPLLATYADDATIVFPGTSSWAGEYKGKSEIERFFQRFIATGLQIEPHQIVVSGAPWDMRICLRFTDRAKGADGEVVYQNTGVVYAKSAWGKIRKHELFEDTQKVAEFDRYLAEHPAAVAGPGS